MDVAPLQLSITEDYKQYFSKIEEELQNLYGVAKRARERGYDPTLEPEPKVAIDFAEMVEGLVGPPKVAERIRELSGIMDRYEMAFKVAEDIVYARFGHMDEQKAAERATRTSLAILTGGITAAPLQGIAYVRVKKNPDRSRYLAIYFAGPIRSAGGTEQALTLVIGDFVRRKLGMDRYKPTDEEIRRFIEEIRIYEREVARFQYHIFDEELENALRNLPVEVTGTHTDPVEVSSFRNLPRVETNRVRGGALRVVNDGIVGRSQKVLKIIDEIGIEGWEWLRRVREVIEEKNDEAEYMKEVIAGRPIFSFPSTPGGFRLRYGRARNTGLAALGIHPATMAVLKNFPAIGTQLRLEKPSKGGIAVSVDTIEPPVVKLKDGSVVRVEAASEAEKMANSIDEILFLGDLLVGFGEFLENNKPLYPPGYSEEWWAQDVNVKIQERFGGSAGKAAAAIGLPSQRLSELLESPLEVRPTAEEAIAVSQSLGVPLHPYFTPFWEAISSEDLAGLRGALIRAERKTEEGSLREIRIPLDASVKSTLETLCVPHNLSDGEITITKYAATLALCLGIDNPSRRVMRRKTPTDVIKDLSGIEVREKGVTYIGARMGRPEKAKRRMMSPPVHVLFPTGLAGGPHRDLREAAKRGVIQVEIVRRRCPQCGDITHKTICQRCSSQTVPERVCRRCGRVLEESLCPICRVPSIGYDKRIINVREMFEAACKALDTRPASVVRGVRGLTSSSKTPEPLEKGVLRAKHQLYVFKDGTIRFDVTNAPITHFKPSEVGASIERLRQLGYTSDSRGKPLREEDQMCELRVQDVIIPDRCAEYLFNAAQFIDELLQRVYGLPPYYDVKAEEDLIGHLIIGLAPHTSVGVVGRVIGFTKASVCYAHPLWHNIKRRDCDGDEDTIMLSLDVLLNFSKDYLPAQIGGMMDAPLLIIPTINPFDADEALSVDVAGLYPLVFYQKALEGADPRVMSHVVDVVGNRLGTPAQFQGYRFTHNTTDINAGNRESIYKKLGPMANKLRGQMDLAEKIRAVDAKEVAERVLSTHFIRDIAGNLRAFTSQRFRCKKCNSKFRRMPLSGRCPRCEGEIVPTVYRGGIEKYLDLAERLAERYGIRNYYHQRLELIRDELEALFKTKVKQVKLGQFM
ncbi:MAG: DNA polymerase II large subunit [Candidatus Bathyarchaeia archaeon]